MSARGPLASHPAYPHALRGAQLARGVRCDLRQVQANELFATQPGRQQQIDDRAIATRATVTVDVLARSATPLQLVVRAQAIKHTLQRPHLRLRQRPRLKRWERQPPNAGRRIAMR